MIVRIILNYFKVFILICICSILVLLANNSEYVLSYIFSNPDIKIISTLNEVYLYVLNIATSNSWNLLYLVVVITVGICSFSVKLIDKKSFLINSGLITLLSLIFITLTSLFLIDMKSENNKISNYCNTVDPMALINNSYILPNEYGVILHDKIEPSKDSNIITILKNDCVYSNDSISPLLTKVDFGIGKLSFTDNNIKVDFSKSFETKLDSEKIDKLSNQSSTVPVPQLLYPIAYPKSIIDKATDFLKTVKIDLNKVIVLLTNPFNREDKNDFLILLLQYLALILIIIGLGGLLSNSYMPAIHFVYIACCSILIFFAFPQLFQQMESIFPSISKLEKSLILIVPGFLIYMLSFIKYFRTK